MNDSEEKRVLVQMKVSRLEGRSQSPEALQVHLFTIEGEERFSPEGKPLGYVMNIPQIQAPIFFAKVAKYLTIGDQFPELSRYYELITKTKLIALHIYSGKNVAARSYMVFRDEAGEENSFLVAPHKGVLASLAHKLPIYVEEKLLVPVEQPEETSNIMMKKKDEPTVSQKEQLSEIIGKIKKGDHPEGAISSGLNAFFDECTYAEIEELKRIALMHENYEWSAVIQNWEKGVYLQEKTALHPRW